MRRFCNVPAVAPSGLAARGAVGAGFDRWAAARAAASKRLIGASEAGAVAGTVGAAAVIGGEVGACCAACGARAAGEGVTGACVPGDRGAASCWR